MYEKCLMTDFQDHVAIPEGLDLVEEEDQITHLLRLEESGTAEEMLSKFVSHSKLYCNFRSLIIYKK
jgi:hypothetical protein